MMRHDGFAKSGVGVAAGREEWLLRLALSLAVLVVSMTAAGCHNVPFDRERVGEIRDRREYVDMAASYVAHDEIYYFNAKSEALLLDALNVAPEILAAGETRWSYDKEYNEAMARWIPDKKGRLVLLGIYNRSFRKEDFLKNGSYKALLLADGAAVEPDLLEEVNANFLEKYFPVFNHWARVFAVHFPVANDKKAAIRVLWPSGYREVELVDPPTDPKGDPKGDPKDSRGGVPGPLRQ
ncbi:MAG: hypothetical protein LBF41_08065 [Deltaproteobacteria bacterium]|jgi:hypothetical protein|nr:hypothetical protein [Deltaproteobacteria bacterium]